MFRFLNELFTGFAFFTFLTTLIRFRDEKKRQVISDLTNIASVIVCLTAIAYIIAWTTGLYERLQSDEEKLALVNRMTGPYWFGYWIYPFCFGIFPQLLWIKKLRKSKVIRIIAAFFLLFAAYIQVAIIWITSLHRDYVSGPITFNGLAMIFDWLVGAIVFAVVLTLTYVFINSKKRL